MFGRFCQICTHVAIQASLGPGRGEFGWRGMPLQYSWGGAHQTAQAWDTGPEMIAYLLLFGSAFAAATILPMQSEAVLVSQLLLGAHPAEALVAVATVGNVLGSVVNWYLGRYLLRFQNKRWFPTSEQQIERAQNWYRRFGRWSLLGSWVPIIGDPLTVVAGVMREPLLSFFVLVTIAKAGRYLLLAAATLAWV